MVGVAALEKGCGQEGGGLVVDVASNEWGYG